MLFLCKQALKLKKKKKLYAAYSRMLKESRWPPLCPIFKKPSRLHMNVYSRRLQRYLNCRGCRWRSTWGWHLCQGRTEASVGRSPLGPPCPTAPTPPGRNQKREYINTHFLHSVFNPSEVLHIHSWWDVFRYSRMNMQTFLVWLAMASFFREFWLLWVIFLPTTESLKL